MSRVAPSLAAYVQIAYPLAETVYEGLEIIPGINIKIDIQKLGIWGPFLCRHAVFSEQPHWF